jgi:hypothetical protein
MTSTAPIFRFEKEVEGRLASMGLTTHVLRDSVARGTTARSRATVLHPPAFGGWLQFGETHFGLREMLLPRGWHPDDTAMFSTVKSPDKRLAIAVALGDDRTGLPGDPAPRTKRSRGALTHLAVQANRDQLGLELWGANAGATIEAPVVESALVTWFLLVHPRHDEVRLELSCPRTLDDSGYIDSWSERILLAPLNTETTLSLVPSPESPGVDVPVRRL